MFETQGEDKKAIGDSIRNIDGDEAKLQKTVLSTFAMLIPMIFGFCSSMVTKKYLKKHFD